MDLSLRMTSDLRLDEKIKKIDDIRVMKDDHNLLFKSVLIFNVIASKFYMNPTCISVVKYQLVLVNQK